MNMANIQDRTDDALICAFQNGEQEAFESLVLRYKNSLYQYILILVKDEGIAGDLFQEVFLAFFKNVHTYEPRGKFKSWLFLTARNRVLNFFRDRDKAISLDQTDEDGNAYLQETLADNSLPPLTQLQGQEVLAQIRQAAAQLPPRQREVLELRQYFSFQEMADMLGRPLGTVLADCHRAVKKMQALLNKAQANEEPL